MRKLTYLGHSAFFIEKDWDEKYGDRMVKLVFIGRDMDKKQIIETLENCIEK